jgi:hypothetical protein
MTTMDQETKGMVDLKQQSEKTQSTAMRMVMNGWNMGNKSKKEKTI